MPADPQTLTALDKVIALEARSVADAHAELLGLVEIKQRLEARHRAALTRLAKARRTKRAYIALSKSTSPDGKAAAAARFWEIYLAA